MIAIAPLRTRRLDVTLRELPIGEAIRLAGLPSSKPQQETSEFLAAAIKEAREPTPRHRANPRAWTVEERTLAVCHYLASTSDEKNFQVGESGRYSDYLMHNKDYPKTDVVELGTIDEATWSMQPLLGAEAEAIETIAFESGPLQHFHWIKGAMAAQLRRNGESRPDAVTDFAEFVLWLRERMGVINAFSESTFSELMRGWLVGQQQLIHFFEVTFNSNGALAMPVSDAADNAQPARFLARSCLSEVALRLGGKPHQSGV